MSERWRRGDVTAGPRPRLAVLLVLVLVGTALPGRGGAGGTAGAQTPGTPPAPASGVAALTAAVLERHYRQLTADSLRRLEPRRALEATAQYIAAQLQQLGFSPARGINTWFQRYPLPGQRAVSLKRSRISLGRTLRGHDKQPIISEQGWVPGPAFSLDFTDAYYLGQATAGPWNSAHGGAVLLTGRQTAATVQRLNLQDRVALYVPPAGTDTATREAVLAALRAATRWVAVADDRDSAVFVAAVEQARRHPPRYVEQYLARTDEERRWPWAIAIRGSMLARFLTGAGVDWAAARQATTPAMEELPEVQFGVWGEPDESAGVDIATAPNVVGMLDGTDPDRQHQYTLITARLPGSLPADSASASAGDSARAAADANAVTAAGLLALATAFSQERTQLKRPVVLAVLSGGAREEGTGAFLSSGLMQDDAQWMQVALDLAGGRGTSGADAAVTVYGASDVTLAPPVTWVAAAHPELNVDVIDGGTAFRPALDGRGFVCLGTPSLYFRRGVEVGAGSGLRRAAAPFAPEPLARLLRLVFYVAEAAATADRPVALSAEGRRALQDCSAAP